VWYLQKKKSFVINKMKHNNLKKDIKKEIVIRIIKIIDIG